MMPSEIRERWNNLLVNVVKERCEKGHETVSKGRRWEYPVTKSSYVLFLSWSRRLKESNAIVSVELKVFTVITRDTLSIHPAHALAHKMAKNQFIPLNHDKIFTRTFSENPFYFPSLTLLLFVSKYLTTSK